MQRPRSSLSPAAALLALLLFAFPAMCRGDVILNVSLDATGLRGNTYGAGGPYSVDFFMTGGQGNNDSVTISNFAVSAASLGSASSFGDVSGSLASSLTVGDTPLFSDFNQVLTPDGTTNSVVITFQMDITTHDASAGIPDNFAFSILDTNGAPIPTTDPFSSLLDFDLKPGLNASQVSVFQTTDSAPTIGPPSVTGQAAVPEPGTMVLLGLGMVVVWTCASRKDRTVRPV